MTHCPHEKAVYNYASYRSSFSETRASSGKANFRDLVHRKWTVAILLVGRTIDLFFIFIFFIYFFFSSSFGFWLFAFATKIPHLSYPVLIFVRIWINVN
jgi:hypothetical protein